MCGGGLRRPPTPVSLNRQPCCFRVVLVRSRSYPKCQPGEVLTTSGSLLGLPSQATADPGSPATETCRAMVGSPGSGRFFQGCEGESVPGVSQLAVSGGRWRPSACGRLTLVSASASHDLVPVCGLCPFPRGHRSRWIRAHLTPA